MKTRHLFAAFLLFTALAASAQKKIEATELPKEANAFLQKHFQFIKLDEANYYLSTAPVEINFMTILMLNIGTFVVTLIFLVLPTMLVTRITPIKALRFE